MSLFAGSYFAVPQIREVCSRITVQHSGPAVNTSTKIVRQFEHIFEPYSTMFKELKETKEAASITVCRKRKQDRQCTYNVTLRRVRVTVVVRKQ